MKGVAGASTPLAPPVKAVGESDPIQFCTRRIGGSPFGPSYRALIASAILEALLRVTGSVPLPNLNSYVPRAGVLFQRLRRRIFY